jgi:hypothetical protein
LDVLRFRKFRIPRVFIPAKENLFLKYLLIALEYEFERHTSCLVKAVVAAKDRNV